MIGSTKILKRNISCFKPSIEENDPLGTMSVNVIFHICCCSVSQLCPTLCDPIDCSTPDFSILHHLPELAQTNACWVNEAIQTSYPLSPASLPLLNHSQHQGLFQWVGSSQQVAMSGSCSFSPSKEYSGLISFRIDWFEFHALQGTPKSLI